MTTIVPDKPTFIFITIEERNNNGLGPRFFARIPFLRTTGEVAGAVGDTPEQAVANLYDVMEGYVILCNESTNGKTTIWQRAESNIQVVEL